MLGARNGGATQLVIVSGGAAAGEREKQLPPQKSNSSATVRALYSVTTREHRPALGGGYDLGSAVENE